MYTSAPQFENLLISLVNFQTATLCLLHCYSLYFSKVHSNWKVAFLFIFASLLKKKSPLLWHMQNLDCCWRVIISACWPGCLCCFRALIFLFNKLLVVGGAFSSVVISLKLDYFTCWLDCMKKKKNPFISFFPLHLLLLSSFSQPGGHYGSQCPLVIFSKIKKA